MSGRLALLFLPTSLVGEGDAVGSYPLFWTNKIIKNLGAHKVTVVKVAEKGGFFLTEQTPRQVPDIAGLRRQGSWRMAPCQVIW